jgi:hypothetical protein
VRDRIMLHESYGTHVCVRKQETRKGGDTLLQAISLLHQPIRDFAIVSSTSIS